MKARNSCQFGFSFFQVSLPFYVIPEICYDTSSDKALAADPAEEDLPWIGGHADDIFYDNGSAHEADVSIQSGKSKQKLKGLVSAPWKFLWRHALKLSFLVILLFHSLFVDDLVTPTKGSRIDLTPTPDDGEPFVDCLECIYFLSVP